MGTRNLVAVMSGAEYKIAQYGQWDGYPDGQGLTCLDFCRKRLKAQAGRDRFKAALAHVRFMTEPELEALDNTDWQATHPHLSRNVAAKILDIVYKSKADIFTKNSIQFAGDSLFCEWAYVIDLDKNALEVYRGFCERPCKLHEDCMKHHELGEACAEKFGRFHAFFKRVERRGEDQYWPVQLVKSYSLDALPTKRNFVKECSERDEDEESAA